MSRCKVHNVAAYHVAVVVNWSNREVQVKHFCVKGHGDDPDAIGDGHSWLEPAKDPDAVLAKVGLQRIGADVESGA